MFKKSIAFTLCILLVLSMFPMGAGGSISDMKQKQQELESQIKEFHRQADALKGKKNSVQEELNALDYELNALNLEVGSYELKKQEINMKIADTEQQIDKLNDEIDENNEILEERLRAMYKMGSSGYIEVVLNADDLVDALTRLDMIQLIVKSDVNLLKDIESQKKDVENLKLSLDTERNELTAVLNDLKGKQQQVVVASRSKASYMTDLEKDIKEVQRQQKEMEAQSAQIEKDILAAQRAVEYAGGELAWPLPGHYRITSNFGPRNDPITGARSFHGGTDIGAPNGTQIVSANDGVVIYVGTHWSYGNYVIVDHGGGISTLYAHCSRVLVTKGQAVSRGEVVALVGSTGYSTGNHLHYEVRLNGVRQNPMSYYK